ncbi:MAG: hypothetical protein ONB15_05330, partial [candidate division KSB1 bacterium]|nr:hypothetical protein [candidate division KSB1 bacterium]
LTPMNATVLHFGAGITRMTTVPNAGAAPDCLQPPLVPRSGFRQQVSASVRLPISRARDREPSTTKIPVEKSIASEFDAKSKVFEVLLKRRFAFEEQVLLDLFALITGLSARLEHVMTNLGRVHKTP